MGLARVHLAQVPSQASFVHAGRRWRYLEAVGSHDRGTGRGCSSHGRPPPPGGGEARFQPRESVLRRAAPGWGAAVRNAWGMMVRADTSVRPPPCAPRRGDLSPSRGHRLGCSSLSQRRISSQVLVVTHEIPHSRGAAPKGRRTLVGATLKLARRCLTIQMVTLIWSGRANRRIMLVRTCMGSMLLERK